MAITLAPGAREVHLTAAALASLEILPIVAGDSCDLAFAVVDDDGIAENLTGATIAMSIRRAAGGEALLTRTTAADLAGEVAGTKQIALSGTPTDGTFTVRFRAGDEAALRAIAESPGAELYDVRIKFSASRIETRAEGRIEVQKPLTPNSSLP